MKSIWTILALALCTSLASGDVSFDSFKTIPDGQVDDDDVTAMAT
jgi:hypothetical protein